MAQIIATTSELRNKATNLRNLNGKLKDKIEQLETYATQLNGEWEGEAKNKFMQTFQTDKSKMLTFTTEIDNYCNRLDDIASRYDQKETENMNLIHSH